MATCALDGALEIRDIATGTVLHDLSSPDGNRTVPPVFSPECTILMAGCAIWMWR